jgi:ABC-type branched-subunit amino acid transport system substrate-binding protein
VTGFIGSNPIKFLKHYADQGMKAPVLGSEATGDDSILRRFGDEAAGLITAEPYSMDLPTESNRRFMADFTKAYS